MPTTYPDGCHKLSLTTCIFSITLLANEIIYTTKKFGSYFSLSVTIFLHNFNFLLIQKYAFF